MAFDPRSYLAEAALVHASSVDATATATTIINYYEAIATHLQHAEAHRKISAHLQQGYGVPMERGDADDVPITDGHHPNLLARPTATTNDPPRRREGSAFRIQRRPPLSTASTNTSGERVDGGRGGFLELTANVFCVPMVVLIAERSPGDWPSAASSSSSVPSRDCPSPVLEHDVLLAIEGCVDRCGAAFSHAPYRRIHRRQCDTSDGGSHRKVIDERGDYDLSVEESELAMVSTKLLEAANDVGSDTGPVPLSRDLCAVLHAARFLFDATDGLFDPVKAGLPAQCWKRSLLSGSGGSSVESSASYQRSIEALKIVERVDSRVGVVHRRLPSMGDFDVDRERCTIEWRLAPRRGAHVDGGTAPIERLAPAACQACLRVMTEPMSFAIDTLACPIEGEESVAPPPLRFFDVDSLAKGWLLDHMRASLRDVLLRRSPDGGGGGTVEPSFLIDWGGDVTVNGCHPRCRGDCAYRSSATASIVPSGSNASKRLAHDADDPCCWSVALPRLPKLQPLFERWKAGLPLPGDLEHMHVVRLRPGESIAASGDYAQLFRYGHTHLVDTGGADHTAAAASPEAPQLRRSVPRLLKVQNHTLGLTAVVTPPGPTSAMWADGWSTALILARDVKAAVRLVMWQRAAASVAVARERSAPTGRCREEEAEGDCQDGHQPIRHYYLAVRNHQLFVHDEADHYLGEGDAQRADAADFEAQKRHLLDRIAVSTQSATPHDDDGDVAKPFQLDNHPHRGGLDAKSGLRDDDAALLVDRVKSIARSMPAVLAIALVAIGGASGGGHTGGMLPHAALLSSIVELPDTVVEEEAGDDGDGGREGNQRQRFAFCKRTFVINVARGTVLHSALMVQALADSRPGHNTIQPIAVRTSTSKVALWLLDSDATPVNSLHHQARYEL